MVDTASIAGREAELARVAKFIEAVPVGVAGLLIQGEPGIVKTTVWKAGLALADARSYTVLKSRPAEAETKLSFSGLRDLFDPTMDAVLPALPEPQGPGPRCCPPSIRCDQAR